MAATLALCLFVAGFYTLGQLRQTTLTETVFEIEPGSYLSEVMGRLLQERVIRADAFIIKVYAFLTRSEGTIKAGQYLVEPGLTVPELFTLFRSGRVMQHQVTFPEGWRFADWLARLGEQPYLRQEAALMTRAQIAVALGIQGDPEGWLFPDTYTYVKGDADTLVLQLAHRKMQQVLNRAWQARNPSIEVRTPHEALILASIIEKETGHSGDREKISSVFHNRLHQGMRLQSDPTVIYGLGEAFDGNLKRLHLRSDTAYNTYTRRGLPPTPICSPGAPAIAATIAGSNHPYLYFVAKGNGESYFSTSLEEHNQAVNRYQKNRTP